MYAKYMQNTNVKYKIFKITKAQEYWACSERPLKKVLCALKKTISFNGASWLGNLCNPEFLFKALVYYQIFGLFVRPWNNEYTDGDRKL